MPLKDVDKIIIQTLAVYGTLRYLELSEIVMKKASCSIRTFDLHLKKLVNEGKVFREVVKGEGRKVEYSLSEGLKNASELAKELLLSVDQTKKTARNLKNFLKPFQNPKFYEKTTPQIKAKIYEHSSEFLFSLFSHVKLTPWLLSKVLNPKKSERIKAASFEKLYIETIDEILVAIRKIDEKMFDAMVSGIQKTIETQSTFDSRKSKFFGS